MGHHSARVKSIGGVLATRIHDGKKAFTAAYFHSGEQLRDKVTAAGCDDAEVFGIEGPAWSMLAAAERDTGQSFLDSALFESALTAARRAEPCPEPPAASSHLLAIARRPT